MSTQYAVPFDPNGVLTAYLPQSVATSVTAVSGPVALYPDYQAKPDTFTPSDGLHPPCPRGAVVGADSSDNEFAAAVTCGREWCEKCGRPDGWLHKRRLARWWGKATQMESMTYVVATVPPSLRWMLRDQWAMSDLGRRSTRLMKRMGFDRGLRGWHLFGDVPDGVEPEQATMPYHPHLNLLVDGGFWAPAQIERMKRGWRRILAETQKAYVARQRALVDAVETFELYERPVLLSQMNVHVSYTSEPAKMAHLVKYVVRPTFEYAEWDEALAVRMLGLRGRQAWGKWDGPALWGDEEREEVGLNDEARKVGEGVSPIDGTPIVWHGRVPFDVITESRGWEHIDAGYYVRRNASGVRRSEPVGAAPWRYRAVYSVADQNVATAAHRAAEKVRLYGALSAYVCRHCGAEVLLSDEDSRTFARHYVDLDGRPHRETCGRGL